MGQIEVKEGSEATCIDHGRERRLDLGGRVFWHFYYFYTGTI